MSKPLLAAIQARLDALERATFGEAHHRLTKRQLAELEGCSTRSIDRGVVRGIYAPPEIENGRCYWWSNSYRRESSKPDTKASRAARDPRLRVRHAIDKQVSRRGPMGEAMTKRKCPAAGSTAVGEKVTAWIANLITKKINKPTTRLAPPPPRARDHCHPARG